MENFVMFKAPVLVAVLGITVAVPALVTPASAGPRDWCASDCMALCRKSAMPQDYGKCISWNACGGRPASPCRADPPAKVMPTKAKQR